ncbi:lysosomal alpha-mannosidase-like [Zophobas morio]|uniref:lysosomal alpha-mannosidase-like n=1 Tax=Zophobas morio TaxID=2755281 RepID=UPI00308354A3
MLDEAVKETEKPLSKIVSGLLLKDDSASVDLNLVNCLRANMSICDNSKKDRIVVAIQNPLSKSVSHYVRLPVDNENYKITGPEDDGDITFDIFDTIHPFDFVTDGEPATKELVFLAKDLPPLGVKLYYVEKIDDASDKYHKFEDIADVKSFGDDNNGFTIDDNGKLAWVTINGQLVNLQQDFLYYKRMASGQASGAYIFRPDGSAIPIKEKLTTVKYALGSLVDEVYQVFDDEITQIIKVYKGEEDSYLEFD